MSSKFNLSECQWTVSNKDKSIKLPATIPGTVHMDLLNAGLIQDPYVGNRDTEYRWVGNSSWTFKTTFHWSKEQGTSVYLIAEGLDTCSQLFLNNKLIGSSCNQFVRYIYAIHPTIGQNELVIDFENPVEHALLKAQSYPYVVPDGFAPEQFGERNRNFIRKEQCSFSWDWGPCFIPSGIWKDLYIMPLQDSIWIQDWTVDISKSHDQFLLQISVWVLSSFDSCWATISINELVVEGEIQGSFGRFMMLVPASLVQLWFPSGYGKQPLYKLNLSIRHQYTSDIVLANSTKKIGFRTVELVQDRYEKDQPGTSFYFRVNGIDIFAKGTNWIPSDCFESRVTKESLSILLHSCKEANMNMVRVWGGGIYQHDAFYDVCDELGLLVWQEFMFACAMYPTDDEFLSNVQQEANHQIKRLMSHPCIALWSGNNENEEALVTGWYEPTKKNPFLYAVDYHRLYHDVIMKSVNELDKTRQFISSSPYNGVISSSPFTERYYSDDNQIYGDVHYYNYKDDGTKVSKFKSPRFMSEYGFQSMPSFSTFKRISESKDWHPLSPFCIQRNHHKYGQEEILAQMKMHFKVPNEFSNYASPITPKQFEAFCWLSQCVQSLCIKAQTEHYRRLRTSQSHCMGALYWQCNDIWQAPTWSSIEYGGHWKMLHYFVKEFFSPILISSFEHDDGAFQVHITSDLMYPIQGNVKLQVMTWTGVIKKTILVDFELDKLSSKCILLLPSLENTLLNAQTSRSESFLYLSCHVQNHMNPLPSFADWEFVSDISEFSNFYFPTSFERVELNDPKLTLADFEKGNDGVVSFTLLCQSVAPFVWLETEFSGRFDTNGFISIPDNRPKRIRFMPWNNNQSIELSLFKKNLRVYSLYDSLESLSY